MKRDDLFAPLKCVPSNATRTPSSANTAARRHHCPGSHAGVYDRRYFVDSRKDRRSIERRYNCSNRVFPQPVGATPFSSGTQPSLLSNENARSAANHAASVAAWRTCPRLIHCVALATASDPEIVWLFTRVSIVGMKYASVITLSTRTAAPAARSPLSIMLQMPSTILLLDSKSQR